MFIINCLNRFFIECYFCILFAIALLAGEIANAIYAADNSNLWTDAYFLTILEGDEICESLEKARDTEIASVVSENIT